MTTPKNIQDHGWLASDDLSDCADNIARYTGAVGPIDGQASLQPALITPGTGATGVVAQVGGSGPSGATAVKWQEIVTSDGTVGWVPVWR